MPFLFFVALGILLNRVPAQTLTVSEVAHGLNCPDGNPRAPPFVPSFALLQSTGGVTVYMEDVTSSFVDSKAYTHGSSTSWLVMSGTDTLYVDTFSASAGGYDEEISLDTGDPGSNYCNISCIYGSDRTGVCQDVFEDQEQIFPSPFIFPIPQSEIKTTTSPITYTYTGSLVPLATFIAQTSESAPVPTTSQSSATGSSPGTAPPAFASGAGHAPHNSKKLDKPAIVGGAVAGLAVVLGSILWAFILRIRRRRRRLRLGRDFASLDPFDERGRETTVEVPEGQKLVPYSLTGVEQSAVEYQAEAMRKISQSRPSRREFGLTGGLPGPSAAVTGPSAEGGSGAGVVTEHEPAWVAEIRAVVERVVQVEEQLRQNRRESSEAPPEYTTT